MRSEPNETLRNQVAQLGNDCTLLLQRLIKISELKNDAKDREKQAISVSFYITLSKEAASLQEEVEDFLKTIKCDSLLQAQFHKLNQEEQALLTSTEKKIEKLKLAIFSHQQEGDEEQEREELNFDREKCIDNLRNFEPHSLSIYTIWWRRIKLLTLILMVMAAVLTMSLILFTPITSIAALGTGIGITAMALIGLFTGKAAIAVMHSQVFGMDMSTKIEEPTTLAPLFSMFMIPWLKREDLARLTVSLEREKKARAVEYATFDCYLTAISLHIEESVKDKVRKLQLEKILYHAQRIHKEAEKSTFEENYQKSNAKAFNLLKAAIILADEQYKDKDIINERILITNDGKSQTTVKNIMGEKRYPWIFWKNTTQSTKHVSPENDEKRWYNCFPSIG